MRVLHGVRSTFSQRFLTMLKMRKLIYMTMLVMAGLAGCSKPEDPVPVSPPVQIFALAGSSEVVFRRFPGEVVAADSTEMSFDVSGRLIELPAVQGMVATKGVLLARLDDVNFLARRDAARADFNNARDELARRRQLRERGVIAESELDQFQQGFEVAEAALRTAQRALDDTQLLAPFDGRVARRIANINQSVQAKQPVLVFQNISTLEVDIQIPETDMALASQGVTAENAREKLEARVEFPSIPGRQFDLELQSFSTEATRAARTFRVTFYLHPPEGQNILPGMTSTVLLRIKDSKDAQPMDAGVFVVPTSTIATIEGGSWVWKLDAESMAVSRVKVDIVAPTGNGMQIRSADLQIGDELVSSGVRFLSDGMTVRRMPAPNR